MIVGTITHEAAIDCDGLLAIALTCCGKCGDPIGCNDYAMFILGRDHRTLFMHAQCSQAAKAWVKKQVERRECAGI